MANLQFMMIVQSNLLMKIKNNLSITVSNLILKYVEQDIVLSLNVKEITARPCADENWEIGVTEPNELDPVVRTLAKIEDLTICLDKCNPTTGQIDSYEEPILYRCGINLRILQRFFTLNYILYFFRLSIHSPLYLLRKKPFYHTFRESGVAVVGRSRH